jgi:hypothetical protein
MVNRQNVWLRYLRQAYRQVCVPQNGSLIPDQWCPEIFIPNDREMLSD